MDPKLELQGDMLVASIDLSAKVDADKDGKPSVELTLPLVLKIHALEAVGEIMKKDFSQFESIVAALGYKVDLINKPPQA